MKKSCVKNIKTIIRSTNFFTVFLRLNQSIEKKVIDYLETRKLITN